MRPVLLSVSKCRILVRSVVTPHRYKRCYSVDKIRVYTRTGDGGASSLFNGERRTKTDVVFEALGTTDELNAHVGVANYHCRYTPLQETPLSDHLVVIQSRLLDLGSHIATPRTSSPEKHLALTSFPDTHAALLEQWIDLMDKDLPPLHNFILPGGGQSATQLHVCRSVCRRAERQVVLLFQQKDVDASAVKYLNRLSDFFFVAARYAAHKEGEHEVVYKKSH